MKHLFLAYKLFDGLIKHQPMMTGCYQWLRVFNSDYKNWKTLEQTKRELEEYDVIQINGDPMDLRLIAEVRNVLGNNSSTKLVVNHDHAPELWDSTFPFIQDMKQYVKLADHVFATSEPAQELMELILERNIPLIPHPCETEVLKRFDATNKQDFMIYFWHRYDKQMLMPYYVTKNLKLPVMVGGYTENNDPNHKLFKNTLKWDVLPYLNFPDFIKLIKEAKVGYDPFFSYSYGRTPCDCAALGLPLVCSNMNYSSNICYPETCVNPYDIKKSRELLKELISNDEFRELVIKTASEAVEFFNHENSKERFLMMLDNDKK